MKMLEVRVSDPERRTLPAQRDPVAIRVYLNRLLSMDPTTDASRMVEYRWEFCGLERPTRIPTSDPLAEAQRRKRAEKQLERIRAEFWRMSGSQLRKSLDAMRVNEFPEIKAGVDRLKLLTLYRDDLQKMNKHADCEINLYNTFRRVVMLPPLKAGALKEKYLRELSYSSALKEVKGMIKMLQQEFPDLYQIESAWFQQIKKIRSRGGQSENDLSSVGIGIPGWLIGLVVIVVIRIVIILLRMAD